MNLSSMRLPSVAATLLIVLALGLTACGGDDDESDSAGEQNAPAESEASAAPPLETVLSCLTDAGVDAEEQTSNTSGETIGIDYPGGRTVISFEKNEEDAETLEGVSQSQATGETFREGTIVVSTAEDPAATGDQPAIETCIQS